MSHTDTKTRGEANSLPSLLGSAGSASLAPSCRFALGIASNSGNIALGNIIINPAPSDGLLAILIRQLERKDEQIESLIDTIDNLRGQLAALTPSNSSNK